MEGVSGSSGGGVVCGVGERVARRNEEREEVWRQSHGGLRSERLVAVRRRRRAQTLKTRVPHDDVAHIYMNAIFPHRQCCPRPNLAHGTTRASGGLALKHRKLLPPDVARDTTTNSLQTGLAPHSSPCLTGQIARSPFPKADGDDWRPGSARAQVPARL